MRSADEVVHFLEAVSSLKSRAALTTAYFLLSTPLADCRVRVRPSQNCRLFGRRFAVFGRIAAVRFSESSDKAASVCRSEFVGLRLRGAELILDSLEPLGSFALVRVQCREAAS